MKLKIKRNGRNFPYAEFKDRYGSQCSIQKSSLATEDAIWLGIDNAEPKIMASKAAMFGVKTEETTGWVDYPIPSEVLLSTRMHLTITQVKDLLPILNKFVETGNIE